jgi:hypothetical protein
MSASHENSTFVATYIDILYRLEAFIKSRSTTPSVDQATIRSCVETALREIVSYREWKCMKRVWRVQLKATQTTGTVSYDASNNQLTLVGATWPADAADYSIRVGTNNVTCEIDAYVSPTVITLKSPNVPNDDLTDVTYTLGKPWYALPANFASSWSPANSNATFIGQYVPFEEWYLLDKYSTFTGTSRLWTIGPVPNKYNVTALYVYPWPASNEEYDLLMKFRPRRLSISGKDPWNYAGTVSMSLAGTTVTGSQSFSGTTVTTPVQFKDLMLGSIIRFSDSSTLPTDTNGTNPYVFQATIIDVDTAAKTLEIDTPSPYALSSVKYIVSDPLTLEEGLYDAFLRNCEKQLAYICGMKDAQAVENQYLAVLFRAKIADSPVNQRSAAGESARRITRLRDFKSRPWLGG